MLEVELRPRAQLDLESIFLHIALVLKEPIAAERAVSRPYESIERLAAFPELGTLLEDDELSRTYRRMLSDSRWIYYTYDERTLTIWRIFHIRQDIDDFTLAGL